MFTILSCRYADKNNETILTETKEFGWCLYSKESSLLEYNYVISQLIPEQYIEIKSYRIVSKKQWNDYLNKINKLEEWYAIITDPSLNVQTKLYIQTGGNEGNYYENNPKLIRLCEKMNIKIEDIFNNINM